MTQRVTVRATKSFEYDGRMVEEGDSVSMLPIDAAVHSQKRNVSLTRELRRSNRVTAAPIKDQPVRVRRRRRAAIAVEPTE